MAFLEFDGSYTDPRCGRAPAEIAADGQHQKQVQQAVQHDLLGPFSTDQFTGEQSDHIPERIINRRRERHDRAQRVEQPTADIAGELIGAAQEGRRAPA